MAVEDLTTWTLTNPDSSITVTSSTATATSMNAATGSQDQVTKDQGAAFYSSDFTFHVGPVNISASSSNNSRIIPIGVGLTPVDNFNGAEGCLIAAWVNTATNPTLYLAEFNTTNTGVVPDSATTSATYQSANVAIGTNFWLEFARVGTTAKLKIYSDAFLTLLQTLSFTLSQSLNYRYAMCCTKCPAGSGATISATIKNVDLSPGTVATVLMGGMCL